jgi:hypothetical protein
VEVKIRKMKLDGRRKTSAKMVLYHAEHQIVMGVGSSNELTGLWVTEFREGRSVIFAVDMKMWDRSKSRTVAAHYSSLLEWQQQFRQGFKSMFISRFVHIKFADVIQSFPGANMVIV